MTKISPNLMKNIKLKIQQGEQTPSRTEIKEPNPGTSEPN